MNALTQYLDLYRANAPAIDAHSAGAINALRPRALEALERLGRLPERSDEGYAKTDLNALFAPDMGVNINRVASAPDVARSFGCGVPNLSILLVVMANDIFFASRTLATADIPGLTVMPLARAAKEHPDLVAAHYGTIAPLSTDASVALNTLLAQDGVLIHVERGVKVPRPIQIVNLMDAAAPTLAVRRVLVVAEEGAEVAILACDHTRPGCAPSLSSEVVEIAAAPGARVQWYDIEEATPDSARVFCLAADQERHSALDVCTATLTNGHTRNDFHINARGEASETTIGGMAIGSGSQHIDNASVLHHTADHGRSRQLFKYVLDGEASGAFEGLIEVHPGARFCEAYQNNRNILASAGARMHTQPQLLIYNDDVKCSHGAATGQLSADALFYMQTRGISLEQGRRMLMQAFMLDVIDNIALEPLRDRLRHMVEIRFSGSAGCATAASCHNCK